MSSQTQHTPYVERSPGDPIAAEDWNAMQSMIKADLENIDADKVDGFDASASPEPGKLLALNDEGKLPTDITGDAASVGGIAADAFVLKTELPEAGLITYRRYFKRLEPEDVLVIEHEMAAFPLVDIYELEPLPAEIMGQAGTVVGGPVYFHLYYGHEEPDRSNLRTQDRTRKRFPWGTWPPRREDPYSLDWLLKEAGVEYEEDDTLGDVVHEFWDSFFSGDPNDPFDHATSKWIDDRRRDTVGELRGNNEWPDIRLAVLPRKVFFGWFGVSVATQSAEGQSAIFEALPQDHITLVEVRHLSYDTLELHNHSFELVQEEGQEVPTAEPSTANLMILLKI